MPALIFPKLNIAFVDIPKTSASSVSNWMFDRATEQGIEVIEIYNHPTDSDLKSYGNFKIITTIRNPYDRLVSYYFYLKMKSEQYGFSLIKDIDFSLDFESWAKKVPEMTFNREIWLAQEEKKPEHIRHTYWFSVADPQSMWLADDPDLIIKFENLDEDFKKIQEIFNSDVPLYHLKKTEHLPYKNYYTDELKLFVYELYKKDFVRWQYNIEI